MSLCRKLRLLPILLALPAGGWILPAPASAGVVIVANQSGAKAEFNFTLPDGRTTRYNLEDNDQVTVPMDDKAGIAYVSGQEIVRRLCYANSIHYFTIRDKKLTLLTLTLPSAAGGVNSGPPADAGQRFESLHTIPVMILVDDDEAAVRQLWEKRLRERVAAASAVFERHCYVRLEVVAVGKWTSDNSISTFSESLREFELKVNPAPARLAIGFTSQYQIPKGKTHLGGTRGPLHRHILIREWSQHITKTERLEVLAHEVGHYMGACHSPEYNSVMRATLGDHRSHDKKFRIGFDAPNTLAMCLLSEELRTRPIRYLYQCRPGTKVQLRGVYQALEQALPEDPSVKRYVQLVDHSPFVRPKPTDAVASLTEATRAVVQSIVEAARRNRSAGPTGTHTPLTGDRLAEWYVRQAAASASRLPPDRAAKALLLGLGIALDRSTLLRDSPFVGDLYRRVESDEERNVRLAVLGRPTMRGRHDLLQHFVVSCALTALAGADAAEAAGIVKEMSDSRTGSGFSFVDLSADMAGVTFATYVLDSKLFPARLAGTFTVNGFLPDGADLEEGISWEDFLQQYRSAADDRFYQKKAAIRRRILALPSYEKL